MLVVFPKPKSVCPTVPHMFTLFHPPTKQVVSEVETGRLIVGPKKQAALEVLQEQDEKLKVTQERATHNWEIQARGLCSIQLPRS